MSARCDRRMISAALLLNVFSMAWAQEFRATVTGRITDQTGVGVPKAKVTARNTGTNEETAGISSDEGNYTISFLIPGKYTLAVEASGFKSLLRENIVLQVGDKRTVDLPLEIGGVQETVTVTAAPPLLDEATASRGGVIENLRITELPLNGRNPFQLANLTSGVQFAGNIQFTRPFDNGDNVNFSINGGLRQTNAYLLDGAPDDAVTNSDAGRTRSQENIAYIPTVDATQEFKIQTNFYDAQYGRTGGGIINVTTKSGTNQFHGTVYDFLRRYQWDANTIQNNRAVSALYPNGRPREATDPTTGKSTGVGHTLDQYGTDITGPVVKNKTFFMFGFENYKENTPSPGSTFVPTLLERNGDFSKSGVTIYNPFSTAANPGFDPTKPESISNPRYVRQQFPNNMIPANLLNPAGLAIARAYPVPNAGTDTSRANNYVASPNLSVDNFRNYIGRVDQSFGERERMFFRYAHNRRNQVDQGAAGLTGIGVDAQDPLIRANDNAVVDSVTVLSPTTILDLRAGFTRYLEAALRTRSRAFDPTAFGFAPSFADARYQDITPKVNVAQYEAFGSRGERQDTSNILSFEGNLTKIVRSHTLKFGTDIRDIRSNVAGGSFLFAAGTFSFTRDFTSRVPGFTDASSGNALASLLLGVPASGQIQNAPYLAFRWGYYALYAQDDWKVSQRLTVNLGLRWDTEGSPTERYNRQNRGFALGQPNPLAAQVKSANPADCPACANLTGGLLFAGQGGLSRNAFSRDLNNFQPRIGAAFQLFHKTVIRGGYGIFYLPEASYGGALGYSVNTNFVPTIGGGVNSFIPAGTLSNPFPSGYLAPSGASLGLSTFLGNDITFVNPERKIPHVQQYSFGIQHQLPGSLKLDASYAGSRTDGVLTNDNQAGGSRNLNVPSVSQLAQARLDPNYFNASVTNPFAGLLPSNAGLNGVTIGRRQLLLPYPQFGNVFIAGENVGKLWYDSLQVNVEKRFSAGLTAVIAYTFSKSLEAVSFLNDQDLRPTKNLTSSDRPHRFVVSGVYQLPFGRGKWLGQDAGHLKELLIGGWEYNWIGTIQSGVPVDLPSNVDLIGPIALSNQSYDQFFNTCVLQLDGTSVQPNAARSAFNAPCTNPAFAIRGPNTLRTIPFRTGAVRQPWANQFDMSLSKRFNFTERFNAQARLEAFNVFNTPILGGGNNNPTDPGFGFVTRNQSNFPRQVQLGFKFNF